MAYGLYISAEGAMAQTTRLEALSNNLANVTTPGFKRDLAVFQARYAEATQRGTDYPGSRTINDLGGGVEIRGTKTDYSVGPLKKTKIETDLAVQGDSFFMVRRGNQDLLTKAGNFMLDSLGQLTTHDGYPVLNESGGTITIDPDAGPWTVLPNGSVDQLGNQTKLALVKPQSLGDLVKAGDNLFASLSTPTQVPPEQRQVMQGFLEQSGVKPTQEMVEMIETSRAVEANINMVHFQDQMLETLIDRVLKQS